MTFGGRRRVLLAGTAIDPVTEAAAVATVCRAVERGEGGRIVTPNVDVLRLARTDPAVRAHLRDATLVVADGMPVVWAARLAGTPLPERVAGASLIWSLSYHLARVGGSVYLLGGEPAPASGGGRRAAAVLAAACPGLRVAGSQSPPYGFERDPAAVAEVCARVVAAKPDLALVGLGFGKQEWLIGRLRPQLPMSWFLGCGQAINIVAGDTRRAPDWLQAAGMEWVWRLATDPRRLAGRYLRHDAPYALRLLAIAAFARLRRGRSAGPAGDVEDHHRPTTEDAGTGGEVVDAARQPP
jgi:N-acetylglucosaminyldiphosphoundecaprenol N-acetyl-beta-D-mannosaminyltransferase